MSEYCVNCEAMAKERDQAKAEVETLKRTPPGIVQKARTCRHISDSFTCLECYNEIFNKLQKFEGFSDSLKVAIQDRDKFKNLAENFAKACQNHFSLNALHEALAAWEKGKEGR